MFNDAHGLKGVDAEKFEDGNPIQLLLLDPGKQLTDGLFDNDEFNMVGIPLCG